MEDIRKMMTAFFADYPAIHWTVLELRELSEHITEVDFEVASTDREGNQTERVGDNPPHRGAQSIAHKKTAP